MKSSSKVLWAAVVIFSVVMIIDNISQGASQQNGNNNEPRVGFSFSFNKPITGDGNIKSQTRTINNSNVVNISGNFKVNINNGKQSSVAITADENILPYIDVNTDNNTLSIAVKSNVVINPSQIPTINITVPVVKALNISGKTQLQASNINTDQLAIDLSGKSDVLLAGHTTNLMITASGKSSIQSNNLIAENITINGTGNSNISVNPIKELILNIVGKSDIQYVGNPSITKNIVGDVTIEKLS